MKKLLFLCFSIITLLCGNTVFGDEPADRRTKFINEGFGFKYLDDETVNMDLFISRHGKPIKIIENDVINLWEYVRDEWGEIINKNITLEYDTVFVNFYKYRAWGTNYYQTLLTTIQSKDNRVYLYGIKHGLTLNELEKIVGKVELYQDDYATLISRNDNGVRIWFQKGKIERIEWRYNLQ